MQVKQRSRKGVHFTWEECAERIRDRRQYVSFYKRGWCEDLVAADHLLDGCFKTRAVVDIGIFTGTAAIG